MKKLLLLPAFLVFGLLPQLLLASPWAPTPHVEVNGQARLMLEADLVDLHASFSVEHRDSRLAMQELEQNFSRLQRQLRRQLPEGARLEAGQVSIQPRHARRNDTWQITGYVVSRDLRLLGLPVEQAGQWLEQVVEARPSNLGPINYRSQQLDEQRNPALALALADAREKAETLASASGMRLGQALYVQELGSPRPMPMMRMMEADAVMSASAPELEPSQVEASAQVKVIFELLP